jgi:hypothetical protein
MRGEDNYRGVDGLERRGSVREVRCEAMNTSRNLCGRMVVRVLGPHIK